MSKFLFESKLINIFIFSRKNKFNFILKIKNGTCS